MSATRKPIDDLVAPHGRQVTVETLDVVEDVDGIPAWVKVDREMATVIISPRLMSPNRPETTAQVRDSAVSRTGRP